ncbi:hypothetical protein (apicoplast) [Babesia microti strain RI]|uniref:Uncharacterized protein n=1 Tax=Babesia microti (strain RI) TaxID=1133968 RepID=A0A068W904_BABMR|nr:hypothetical protein [Babesia microti strain RI]CDR32605.1 hypothetical protein [Babesia microti strain RI]|eukprot:YP_009363174.1 hypothetical protein (apicoplast) [Babesia microti strain RI]
MNNKINILKILCRKIQIKGNYLSIKKNIFNLLYNNNIINFEIILLNNLLNILYKLIYIMFKEENNYILNITNLYNFTNFINIIFKFIYNDIKLNKGKVCLPTYLYYLYTNLYNIINKKLNINYNLYKFFYKNYLNYLLKCNNYNNNYIINKKFKTIYFYKYININNIYKKNSINIYLKNKYYNIIIKNYINYNNKKFKKNYLIKYIKKND